MATTKSSGYESLSIEDLNQKIERTKNNITENEKSLKEMAKTEITCARERANLQQDIHVKEQVLTTQRVFLASLENEKKKR